MNAKRLFFVGIVVATVLGVSLYLGLRDPYPPGTSVKLAAQVAQNDWLTISNFEAKVIDYSAVSLSSAKKANEDNTSAVLQWRCVVRNVQTASTLKDPFQMDAPALNVRCCLKIEFTDKDGFVLADTSFDSNKGAGDIESGQAKSIYGDFRIPRSRLKHLAACKITSTALKTDAELAEEQARVIAKRKAAAVEESARWGRLEKGISQTQVYEILGKPFKTEAFSNRLTWHYLTVANPDEGTYHDSEVTFSVGVLESWHRY